MTRQRSRRAAGVSRFQRSARWAVTLAATFGASTLGIMLATHRVRADERPSPDSNRGYQVRFSDLEAAAQPNPATAESAGSSQKRQSTKPSSSSKTATARKLTAKPTVKPTVSHAVLPTDNNEATNSTHTVAAIFAALTGAGRTKVVSENTAKQDEAKQGEATPSTAKRGETQQSPAKQIESKRRESPSKGATATSARLSDTVRVNPNPSDTNRDAEITEPKPTAPVTSAATSSVTTSPESKPFKTVKKRIVKSKKSGAAEANSRDGVDSATSSDTQNAIAAKKADDDLSVEFCATDSVASESFGADIRTASNQPGGARTTRSKEAVAGKNGGSDSEACDESCLTPLRSLSSDHLRLESQPAEKAERAENDSASDSVDEKPEVEVGAEVGADAGADAGDSPRRLKLHSASRADMQKEADRAMDVSKRVLNAIGFRPASTVRSAPSRSN